MEVFQNALAHEIDFLSRNSALDPRRSGQLGVPGVAVNVNALIEDFFAQPGLAAGRRVRAAAFVGAASVETEPDEVVGGLGFEDDGINARLEQLRVFGLKRLFDSLAANASGVEFGDIELVAQKIAGAAAVGGAGGNREANQAGAAILEIPILGGEGRGGAAGMVKPRADDAGLFAGANDFVDRFGAGGQGEIDGGFRETAGGFIGLGAQSGQVFLIHGRETSQLLGLLDGHPQGRFFEIVGGGGAALFVDPYGDAGGGIFHAVGGGKAVGGEAEMRGVVADDG